MKGREVYIGDHEGEDYLIGTTGVNIYGLGQGGSLYLVPCTFKYRG